MLTKAMVIFGQSRPRDLPVCGTFLRQQPIAPGCQGHGWYSRRPRCMHLHPGTNQAPLRLQVDAQSVAFASGNVSHICIARQHPDDNSMENLDAWQISKNWA